MLDLLIIFILFIVTAAGDATIFLYEHQELETHHGQRPICLRWLAQLKSRTMAKGRFVCDGSLNCTRAPWPEADGDGLGTGNLK